MRFRNAVILRAVLLFALPTLAQDDAKAGGQCGVFVRSLESIEELRKPRQFIWSRGIAELFLHRFYRD